MDDRRFDSLTRALGAGGSRRRFLKGLLGFGGITMAGATAPNDTNAARRPPSTPTLGPAKCPGQQTWNGSACICPNGLSKCGPDCCNPGGAGASYSECCDNACCYGTCYGEERCCPYPRSYCPETGECCPAGSRCCPGFGCLDTSLCCSDGDCGQFPNSYCDTTTRTCACTPSTCESLGACGQVNDGCGNTLDCGCCTDADCKSAEFPNGFCDRSTGRCACTQSSCEELEGCGPLPDGCAGTIDCSCGTGYICSDGQCVDDTSICVAGEEYCTGTMGGFCGGGNCYCTEGVDGTTYCVSFLYDGFLTCENCTSNQDCRSKIADPTSVCLNHSAFCEPCNGNGACAKLCA